MFIDEIEGDMNKTGFGGSNLDKEYDAQTMYE